MNGGKVISCRYTNELENSGRTRMNVGCERGYYVNVCTYTVTHAKTYITHVTPYICSVVACVNKDSLIGKLARI